MLITGVDDAAGMPDLEPLLGASGVLVFTVRFTLIDGSLRCDSADERWYGITAFNGPFDFACSPTRSFNGFVAVLDGIGFDVFIMVFLGTGLTTAFSSCEDDNDCLLKDVLVPLGLGLLNCRLSRVGVVHTLD